MSRYALTVTPMHYSIDPGVTGAIIRWHDEHIDVIDIDLTDLYVLSGQLARGPATVILETTHARPITGSKGNFQQGETRGILRGICATHGHRIEEVRPQRWKADLGLIGTGKNASRDLARHLYPQLADSLKRVKDHDRAEAILIGHWYRHIQGDTS